MIKIVGLLLLLLFVQSCGTIGARRNIVAVDSSPRGATVTSDQTKERPLGVTPFFIEKDKQFYQRFDFKFGSQTQTVRSFCSLNWSESVFPNLVPAVFFPIGTALSGISLLTDWGTGNIYRCSKSIHAQFEGESSDTFKPRNILAIVPPVKDHLKGRAIVEKVLREMNWRDQLIPWDKSEEVLEYFGIDQTQEISISSVPIDHWREIAFRTGAEQLLLFQIEDDHYIPQLVDLVNFNQQTLAPIARADERTLIDYVASAFSFFPNAMTLSYMSDISGTSVDDPNNNHVHQYPRSLPLFLSLWGFENISNPRLLSPWDFELKFSPVISFPAFRYQDENYWINGQRFTLGYGGALTLHSPFGAVSLGMSLGPAYSRYEDSEGQKKGNWQFLASQASLAYYAFLTERFYFKMAVTHYNFSKDEYQGKVDGLTVTMVTLGYYIPHLKWKLRQLSSF